eukprot:1147731-Pelagomonas_calceolata.AAC.1
MRWQGQEELAQRCLCCIIALQAYQGFALDGVAVRCCEVSVVCCAAGFALAGTTVQSKESFCVCRVCFTAGFALAGFATGEAPGAERGALLSAAIEQLPANKIRYMPGMVRGVGVSGHCVVLFVTQGSYTERGTDG